MRKLFASLVTFFMFCLPVAIADNGVTLTSAWDTGSHSIGGYGTYDAAPAGYTSTISMDVYTMDGKAVNFCFCGERGGIWGNNFVTGIPPGEYIVVAMLNIFRLRDGALVAVYGSDNIIVTVR